jgi:nicotinamide riboside transporter PnuC
MRKPILYLLSLFTLMFAILIQIDMVFILRIAASGISTPPLGIYLLWIPVEVFSVVTYRFYVENSLWFFFGSDLLIVLAILWIWLAHKKSDRYPYNRYHF